MIESYLYYVVSSWDQLFSILVIIFATFQQMFLPSSFFLFLFFFVNGILGKIQVMFNRRNIYDTEESLLYMSSSWNQT